MTSEPRSKQRTRWLCWFAGAAALGISVSACGGSGKSSSTTTSSSSTQSTGSSVSTGPVRATLQGMNHSPKVGTKWEYTLHVHDASGHPLSGTVNVQFVLGQLVVGHDTPRLHALKNGVLREKLTFPANAVGHAIALQTVVRTKQGSVTLNWPVTAVP